MCCYFIRTTWDQGVPLDSGSQQPRVPSDARFGCALRGRPQLWRPCRARSREGHMKNSRRVIAAAVAASALCNSAQSASWCAVPGALKTPTPVWSYINREGVTREKGAVELSAAFLRQRLVHTSDGRNFSRRGEPFVPEIWSVWTRLSISCKANTARVTALQGHDVNGAPVGELAQLNRAEIEPKLDLEVVLNAVCEDRKPRRRLACTDWSVPERRVFRPRDSEASREERSEAAAAYRRATSVQRRPQ